MITDFFKNIKGDRTIWAIIGALAIFSFLPVYSASTNLVYVAGKGTTFGYLFKHALLLVLGFGIVYATHKIPYRYFSGLSVLMLPVGFRSEEDPTNGLKKVRKPIEEVIIDLH